MQRHYKTIGGWIDNLPSEVKRKVEKAVFEQYGAGGNPMRYRFMAPSLLHALFAYFHWFEGESEEDVVGYWLEVSAKYGGVDGMGVSMEYVVHSLISIMSEGIGVEEGHRDYVPTVDFFRKGGSGVGGRKDRVRVLDEMLRGVGIEPYNGGRDE